MVTLLALRLSTRRLLLLCFSMAAALITALPSLYHLFPHTSVALTHVDDDDGSMSLSEFPPIGTSYGSNYLKPRRHFKSYEDYLQLQLNKTLNVKLRKVWTTRDWRRKVEVFSPVFQSFVDTGLLNLSHRALCIGARVGQEVVALKEIGVRDAIGIDLVPSPPLVIKGDIHRHPFADNTFDFEFSNVFDHAVFPHLFVSEIERTLKPHGAAVLHVAIHRHSDRFSANDLLRVDALTSLFKISDIVHVREVDALGLDTEVVMMKRGASTLEARRSGFSYDGFLNMSTNCSKTRLKQAILDQAEPLIITEPKKPWITLKQNMRSVRYLPTMSDIGNHRRYLYVDVGARNYGSSIGTWFKKLYPKQGQKYDIFAIEADRSFQSSYDSHSDVTFMPYAAWIRNESLMFGSISVKPNTVGHKGMGRIQRLNSSMPMSLNETMSAQVTEVHGLDFAEWIKATVAEDDFLLLKMDVEGSEFDLLPRMFETGAICLVDELFLECHYNRWQRCCSERTAKYTTTYRDCLNLFQSLRRNGVLVHQWW